ncbi:MAG: hypothetical protein R2695_00175 [Acidimicrobiales bacterium]
MANHPVREHIDLMDGNWYASEPHDDWTWMRANAPVYYDPNSDVWAVARYDDILTVSATPDVLLVQSTAAQGATRCR